MNATKRTTLALHGPVLLGALDLAEQGDKAALAAVCAEIREAMRACDGNRSHAADYLGVTRRTASRRLWGNAVVAEALAGYPPRPGAPSKGGPGRRKPKR